MPPAGRNTWSDRFTRPTAAGLLGGLEPDLTGTIDRIRALLAEKGLIERLGWHGIAWGWSLGYRRNARDELAQAYLAPRGGQSLLIIPIALDRIDLSTLPGGIRQTIAEAKTVDQTAWCEWTVLDTKGVDELLGLIDLDKPQ